ncbi:magnesium-translocating P-type ATPase [Ramlibacter sp. H39-3-26]|uniref:magnesium-translocating P-type ATPase n=1 Tax=Curvibacter soli TaxID=3031331 RepID=UPI0023D9D49C|nr:magnesium-translocating P-type ATPase [Ramlibacter sp. H39-3-26]MDF1485587.1 magnesium-translocating P-type ATPase [Ramlibacter sp. H39-3-26]
MHLPTSLFASFLQSRRVLRHFRRPTILWHEHAAGARQQVPPALAQGLRQVAGEDAAALLLRLGTREDGLTPGEAEARLAKSGPNEVGHEKALPLWLHLWLAYKNPFSLLLTALAVISYLTEDVAATVVIATMVAVSTLIRLVQERRSGSAAEALKAMVRNTATVLRHGGDGQSVQQEVPMRALVPGDVVHLSAGDMVPADCRLLAAKDLFVGQAAMTGESLPVEKFATSHAAAADGGAQTDVVALPNIVFMGTNVVSGTATAVVVSTGARTYFGMLADHVMAAGPTATAFQAGVNQVSWLLIRFALVMVPIVLLVNGFTKGDWMEAFLFALSVAVGLTPEMLPMIVTSTLAKGAVQLSRRKVVVKRLDAIQNFGAMDILCTDKTGTLTQDHIVLGRNIDVLGAPSDEVLEFAYLNSYYQTGLKNLLDHAVLEHAELQVNLKLHEHYHKVDEIPFDFQRRRMSVVVSERDDHHELICKGAVEEVLAACSSARIGGAEQPLDAALLARVRAVTAALNADGLRVVAVAMKEITPGQAVYSVADEAGLTLVGYIAFLDPPKESAAPALQALAAHGVRVKVLTGDNDLVAARVCRSVGLAVDGVLLGSAVEAMDDAQLADAAERHTLFARLAPLHKERLVRALRSRGHVVGFLGDGINDAPALRAADIGISVDSAVDIAKEAADIILLEKSLMVLKEGVVEGRRVFSNMLKYIRMAASSNFGNVFSVLLASIFLPFLPMLPLQLLVQNLLYDISQIAIPFDRVDDDLVRLPLHWNPGAIRSFMLCFGPISSVFDVLTFALLWHMFGASDVAHQALFHSGWFVEGLLSQTLIVHMIRSPRLPFLQSRPAAALLATTLAIMAVGVWLPMGPLAVYFKLVPLPPAYFGWLVALLLGYATLTQLMKRFYLRRFPWQ